MRPAPVRGQQEAAPPLAAPASVASGRPAGCRWEYTDREVVVRVDAGVERGTLAAAKAMVVVCDGCQQRLGDGEQVLDAVGVMEGPSPTPRMLLLSLAALGLFCPGGVWVHLLVINALAVGLLALTSIWWKRRVLARTDRGLVLFERRLGGAIGEVLARAGTCSPERVGGSSSLFVIDGRRCWVPNLMVARLEGASTAVV